MDEAKAAAGWRVYQRGDGGEATTGEGVVLLQSTYRHPCRRL